MEVGSFTAGSTGNKIIILNKSFTPRLIEFEVGPRTGTNETHVIRSSGVSDGTYQFAISTYADGSTRATRESTSHCITHYAKVGGTLTKVLSGSIVSFDEDEFTINMDAADSNYTIRFKAYE